MVFLFFFKLGLLWLDGNQGLKQGIVHVLVLVSVINFKCAHKLSEFHVWYLLRLRLLWLQLAPEVQHCELGKNWRRCRRVLFPADCTFSHVFEVIEMFSAKTDAATPLLDSVGTFYRALLLVGRHWVAGLFTKVVIVHWEFLRFVDWNIRLKPDNGFPWTTAGLLEQPQVSRDKASHH